MLQDKLNLFQFPEVLKTETPDNLSEEQKDYLCEALRSQAVLVHDACKKAGHPKPHNPALEVMAAAIKINGTKDLNQIQAALLVCEAMAAATSALGSVPHPEKLSEDEFFQYHVCRSMRNTNLEITEALDLARKEAPGEYRKLQEKK